MIVFDPIVSWTAALLVACLFTAAAWHKSRDFTGFREALDAYRLLPTWSVGSAAVLVIATEVATMIGLALRLEPAHLIALSLLGLYSAAMSINLLRGRRYIDCGCGGAGQPVSWGLVVRNVLLMGVCLLAAPEPGGLDLVGGLTVAAAVVTGACLYAAANHILMLRALLDEPES